MFISTGAIQQASEYLYNVECSDLDVVVAILSNSRCIRISRANVTIFIELTQWQDI
jgi:hypothetical protein